MKPQGQFTTQKIKAIGRYLSTPLVHQAFKPEDSRLKQGGRATNVNLRL